ncbi:OmpR Response regulators consisting of a CheY-like receiver domain and a winged-helix DNA-binding domain [Sphingomonadaceae bacterium]
MARIMLVEDDNALARGVLALLRADGHAVDHFESAEDALELLDLEPYTLILLDLGLPGMSGFDVVRELRRSGQRLPVLILTARDALDDRVRGLDLGADDYMLKPFDPTELSARVRALLRRSTGEAISVISVGNLTCDIVSGTAKVNGRSIELRRREWAVLIALAHKAGHVVPKDRLISEVFDYDDTVGPNALEVYITRLRKKLSDGGPNIRALRGLGYIMEV